MSLWLCFFSHALKIKKNDLSVLLWFERSLQSLCWTFNVRMHMYLESLGSNEDERRPWGWGSHDGISTFISKEWEWSWQAASLWLTTWYSTMLRCSKKDFTACYHYKCELPELWNHINILSFLCSSSPFPSFHSSCFLSFSIDKISCSPGRLELLILLLPSPNFTSCFW